MPAPKDPKKREEWIRKNREWHIGKISTKRSGIMKKCVFCNKEFYVPKYKIKAGKGIYCSKECYNKIINNTLHKSCLFCGKKFISYGSHKRKFCSKKCHYNSKKEIRICIVCKTNFEISKSIKRYTCSSRCAKTLHRGSTNGMWKGKEASYSAFHHRLTAIRGKPKKCEVCGENNPSKRYEWANLKGDYPDPYDYKRMCTSCHRKFDNKKKG